MPRQARIDAPGAVHHIICRGIERTKIFRNDTDRHLFISRLGHVLIKTSTRCFAWALIPNHFHLLLQTGLVPIATVMRRLLTGYAVAFNLRHHRSGHLFQNRYKSILCQKEIYLLQLVRYIHLNPLRAGIVKSAGDLERYPFCGHGAILDIADPWQETDEILRRFSACTAEARAKYLSFVADGVESGRRPELIGGGLVRSAGGWEAVSMARRKGEFLKSDERILGDSDFVESVLSAAQEQLEKRAAYRDEGIDLERAARKAASLIQVSVDELWKHKKARLAVQARSLFCFWATRELGVAVATVAARTGLTPSAVSRASERGERLATEKGWSLR